MDTNYSTEILNYLKANNFIYKERQDSLLPIIDIIGLVDGNIEIIDSVLKYDI